MIINILSFFTQFFFPPKIPQFYVYLGSSQAISDATDNLIEFGNNLFDNFKAFDRVTNFDYTIPIDGTYLLTLSVTTSVVPDGAKWIGRIRINGQVVETFLISSGAVANMSIDTNTVRQIEKGDLVTAHIEYDNFVDAETLLSGANQTYFSGILISFNPREINP